MGCASSTPMVATAGSEMLKAATHAAGDVKQKDVTESLNATVDTAKETVSSAVAGITNELGNAFKDGSEKLDEAKHKVMEGLHLETRPEVGKTTETEVMSSSRAPTPALDADADSLKTSTPEPEIERALANSSANEEEAPPTPKPSLQELAELSAQVGATADATVATATATAADADADATATATATVAAANVESRMVNEEEEERRPSTTEWEKLADQLAKSRKFKPYESFTHSQNQFSVYKDYTSLRDKPGHYDGHFSGGNSQQSSASQSQSDLSSGHLTPAPPTRRGHRDYAKFVGSEQPASVSRASSRLSLSLPPSNVGRTFDFNPQRDRISLPIATGRVVGSRVGSALNGRRSLWARGQPEVLPEEPHHTFSPIRRSSMTVGLRDKRNQQVARSTSNLTSASLTRRKEAKKKDQPRLTTADAAKKQLPGSRRPSEPAYKEIGDLRVDRIGSSRSQKSERVISLKPDKSALPVKEAKTDFKAMLMDSARDISSAVLLATPLTTTSMLHSPSNTKRPPTVFSPISTSTNNKMPTPLASRASTFIAETTESRSSVVKYATPIKTPQLHTPTRRKDSMQQHSLPTPRKLNSEHTTPQRMNATAEPILATTSHKSPSQTSSRLSSASSSEIVIRPLSLLNTPSAVSGSPGSSQIVMTEYEDIDLESALARLADSSWRGSTTTLHSVRSSNSRMGRNSQNSSRLDSRRTSPWIRNKANRTFSTCGIAELSSPSRAAQKSLERCEICCNEIVMN
ncbi:hypothetical protein ACLKA7_016009 [Drosophila subpalustris]